MTIPRSAPWTAQEIVTLRACYPAEGHSVAQRLPGRSVHALQVKAHKLGLKTAHRNAAPRPRLGGGDLDEAIRLREVENWSFSAIGKHFGICEASACNAVTIALCVRRGYRPAERDQHGRLTAEGIERLWEVSQPLLEAPPPVRLYQQGSWGPKAVHQLIAPHAWRLPFERAWRKQTVQGG